MEQLPLGWRTGAFRRGQIVRQLEIPEWADLRLEGRFPPPCPSDALLSVHVRSEEKHHQHSNRTDKMQYAIVPVMREYKSLRVQGYGPLRLAAIEYVGLFAPLTIQKKLFSSFIPYR